MSLLGYHAWEVTHAPSEVAVHHLMLLDVICGGTVPITFIDSTGLNALLAVDQAHRDSGSVFILIDPSPPIRLLTLTQLSSHFTIKTQSLSSMFERHEPGHAAGFNGRSTTATGEGLPVLIAITLDPLSENITEARHRITHVLARGDVDPEQCQRVVLALSELATNAFLHGSLNPIRIEVLLDGDAIELRVSQEADGAAIPDIAAWRLPDEKSQIGGRGLAIVDAIDTHIDGERAEIRARFLPRADEPTVAPFV